jgi:hypothetical protein
VIQDDLVGALRTLIDDLRADRPTALATFETWCLAHGDDKKLQALIDELGPLNGSR